jgi:chemotaxis protein methyltransferase CheR
MAQNLSEASFVAVTRFFEQVSGIKLVNSKQALVQGRLQRLALDAGYEDLDDYVNRVVQGKLSESEITKVIDRLTTNETYFFREPEHFKRLRQQLLSLTLPRDREISIWSAASSSGEEAYSIAMLLADVVGLSGWRIHGTDLSTAMVRAARRGVYPMERASGVPATYLKKYCRKGTGSYEGQLLVAPEIRQRVSFMEANLMKDLPDLPMFDVIFLRNVLIYFDNEGKSSIVRRVLTKLKPHGELYTGHAESLSSLQLPIKTITTAVHGHA